MEDYVDLNLPSKTLWAKYNVGANEPQQYGSYFTFDESLKIGTLPSKEQIKELYDNCDKIVTEYKGVKGIQFMGKNMNCLFMPFAGYCLSNNEEPYSYKEEAHLWSNCSDTYFSIYSYCLGLYNNGKINGNESLLNDVKISVRLVALA